MIIMVIDQNDNDRSRSSQGMIELPNINDPLYFTADGWSQLLAQQYSPVAAGPI